MDLDAALSLVAELTPLPPGPVGLLAQTDDVGSVPASELRAPVPSLALGVAEHDGDFKLAVRVQDPAYIDSARLRALTAAAHGEVDVQFVGLVRTLSLRVRTRPVHPGLSCAHATITAGTLGAFVMREGVTFALSNNHVFAASNVGDVGDAILQPGPVDGGVSTDRMGELAGFVPIDFGGINDVDCALCRIDPDVAFDVAAPRMQTPAGICPPEKAGEVQKIGRTTGLTEGRVRSFNINNLVVQFPGGTARFDHQLEIIGNNGAFSEPGDSGSLIVTREDAPRAVGLLFAGTAGDPTGSPARTFANPASRVLSRLGCKLC